MSLLREKHFDKVADHQQLFMKPMQRKAGYRHRFEWPVARLAAGNVIAINDALCDFGKGEVLEGPQ